MIQAIDALSALAQPTRLAACHFLVQAGQDGMAAGDIAAALNVRQNTMSTNLLILVEAGLARNSRDGRTIRYSVNLHSTRQLLGFLVQDCCGGRPELCQPLMDQITCACQEKTICTYPLAPPDRRGAWHCASGLHCRRIRDHGGRIVG